MDLMEWVADATDNASARQIARRLNRSNDSVSRWLKRGVMPAEVIVQLSRVYHGNLLEGALAAGVVTVADVEKVVPDILHYATTVQLTEELHRRMVREARA